MTVSIDGANGVVFNDLSTQNTAATGFGFKNRIINGAMVIDQRNAGASVTATTTGIPVYTIDRFYYFASQASKYTVQQNAGSVTPPAGYKTYVGITSSSAYSIVASDLFIYEQKIEGYNFADLNWGTANAVPVTFSFWVRSSLTGTFSGSLRNENDTRSYPYVYTISSANTWEQKTITIAGDTTGTWTGATIGTGLKIGFSLGSGSTYSGTAGAWAGATYTSATGATSVVGTSGATFYITGVQLEKGSTATSFDYRDYGRELIMCQRYYQKLPNSIAYLGGSAFSTNRVLSSFSYNTTMRVLPTATTGATSFLWFVNGGATTSTAVALGANYGSIAIDATVVATTGVSGVGQLNVGVELNAEL